jgi:O-antigen ligase
MGFANPKSLWLRLLAETGILGFLAFILWLIVLAFVAISFNRRKRGLPSVLGLASGLALIALIFEGFSLDTFALPQLWIILGLLTACSMMKTDEVRRMEQPL